jgi:SAM-dependent methyltransferase
MVYRITEEEIFKQWKEYRDDYPPFVPYGISERELQYIAKAFSNVIKTQNGQDFDDYPVTDDRDLTQRYLQDTPKGSSILLLGVGTGREVVAAKELGYRAIGTTLGSRNVEFGLRYLGLTPGEIRECLCEVLPFRNETFDVVAGYQVFEHVLSPLTFLLEQSRVLKFGGRLVLEWPPAHTHTMEDNPHHQVCFTPGQARGLFLKAGFVNVKLCYDDLTPIPEEEWWSAASTKMLCIEGTKVACDKDYVRRAWGHL